MVNAFDELLKLVPVVQVFLESLILLDDFHEGSKEIGEDRAAKKEDQGYVNTLGVAPWGKVSESNSRERSERIISSEYSQLRVSVPVQLVVVKKSIRVIRIFRHQPSSIDVTNL